MTHHFRHLSLVRTDDHRQSAAARGASTMDSIDTVSAPSPIAMMVVLRYLSARGPGTDTTDTDAILAHPGVLGARP